jgi:hypothetical protein
LLTFLGRGRDIDSYRQFLVPGAGASGVAVRVRVARWRVAVVGCALCSAYTVAEAAVVASCELPSCGFVVGVAVAVAVAEVGVSVFFIVDTGTCALEFTCLMPFPHRRNVFFRQSYIIIDLPTSSI